MRIFENAEFGSEVMSLNSAIRNLPFCNMKKRVLVTDGGTQKNIGCGSIPGAEGSSVTVGERTFLNTPFFQITVPGV